jgi:hypothetical protein
MLAPNTVPYVVAQDSSTGRDKEFFLWQYQSLREEIKETKSRAYRTLTIGFAVLPAAELLGDKIKESAFISIVPFLIMIFAMIYLSQNHEVMRCGRFIRVYIEPRVPSVPGWETYLESDRLCPDAHTNSRTVDRYIIYAFYGVFLLYYMISSVMAVEWIQDHANSKSMASTFAIVYTASGIAFGVFLNKNLRSTTTTDTKEASRTVMSEVLDQIRPDDTN